MCVGMMREDKFDVVEWVKDKLRIKDKQERRETIHMLIGYVAGILCGCLIFRYFIM